MKRWMALSLITLLVGGCAAKQPAPAVPLASSSAQLSLSNLRCEYRTNTLGIDTPQPRLSWELASDVRGQCQSAYEIIVSPTDPRLPRLHWPEPEDNCWDSGKVSSDQTTQITYGGSPLQSWHQYFWMVRTWDKDGQPCAWSTISTFTTGLLTESDWQAKWITRSKTADQQAPMPEFRREFSVTKTIRSAHIAICGLGQFELHINGQKISRDILQPGWTDYSKTCLYVLYDVTKQLHQGNNAVGVMLGNGMYNCLRSRYVKFAHTYGPLKLIAQIHIEYQDGSIDTISTDSAWKSANGPITFSNIYGGEDFDARKDQPGWDQPDFASIGWSPAIETEGPGGKLYDSTRSALPVTIAKTFTAIKITSPKPNVKVYDFGQNCAEIPRITVSGPAGSQVKLIPAELLAADGTVNQRSGSKPVPNVPGPGTICVYTLSGKGTETWSPRFFYFGSRYVQVEVAPAPNSADASSGAHTTADQLPVVQNVESQFITSISPPAGEFSCSNDLFNRAYNIIRWAMRSNIVSLLTDCPHRERLGWLEQDNLVGPSLTYCFDLSVMLSKVCSDMSDAQTKDGMVPNIAPEYTKFKAAFRDSPEWGSSSIFVPWQMYQWYGDKNVLAQHFDMMKRYVDYLHSKNSKLIQPPGLGDWLDMSPGGVYGPQITPRELTATAYFYRDTVIVAQTAKLLGKPDDAAKYAALAEQIRDAFNTKFYDAAKHRYATGSQAAEGISLVMGLVPEADQSAVLAALISDVRAHDNQLTAGDVGFRYVLQAFAQGDRNDVVFDMNSGSDHPGYGYVLKMGETAMPETWTDKAGASHDHFMLGHIVEWFYADLAGIQRASNSPDWRQIVIRPNPVGDVTWVKASYHSIRGPIVSNWTRQGTAFTLEASIPPGCTAQIWLPASPGQTILESGQALNQSAGVHLMSSDDQQAIIKIDSGNYVFNVK